MKYLSYTYFLLVLMSHVFLTDDIHAQTLDMNKSRISAVSRQMNVPVEGSFRKFSAKVNFDASKLNESKAILEIETASFDLGAEEFNKEVRKKEWFDSGAFPKALFTSTAIKPLAPGRYEVSGNLMIKGQTQPLTIPVTLKNEGKNLIFEGVLPLRRLTFKIGEGEWKDTSMVADEVQVRFLIVLLN